MALAGIAASCARTLSRARGASLLWSAARKSSQKASKQQRFLPKTSLSSPPWPEIKLPDPEEEAKYHRELVQKVNEQIADRQYGRLFAVVHFASRQWKVTNEDLILTEGHIQAECGDRIRMEKYRIDRASVALIFWEETENGIAGLLRTKSIFRIVLDYKAKVLLVGADDFTLLGRPLLGKDLVRVEATVIEKTESWPKINMRFRRKRHFQRKKIMIHPQTVLRINTIEIAPVLS